MNNGPWEDYQADSKLDGPWNDYSQSSVATPKQTWAGKASEFLGKSVIEPVMGAVGLKEYADVPATAIRTFTAPLNIIGAGLDPEKYLEKSAVPISTGHQVAKEIAALTGMAAPYALGYGVASKAIKGAGIAREALRQAGAMATYGQLSHTPEGEGTRLEQLERDVLTGAAFGAAGGVAQKAAARFIPSVGSALTKEAMRATPEIVSPLPFTPGERIAKGVLPYMTSGTLMAGAGAAEPADTLEERARRAGLGFLVGAGAHGVSEGIGAFKRGVIPETTKPTDLMAGKSDMPIEAESKIEGLRPIMKTKETGKYVIGEPGQTHQDMIDAGLASKGDREGFMTPEEIPLNLSEAMKWAIDKHEGIAAYLTPNEAGNLHAENYNQAFEKWKAEQGKAETAEPTAESTATPIMTPEQQADYMSRYAPVAGDVKPTTTEERTAIPKNKIGALKQEEENRSIREGVLLRAKQEAGLELTPTDIVSPVEEIPSTGISAVPKAKSEPLSIDKLVDVGKEGADKLEAKSKGMVTPQEPVGVLAEQSITPNHAEFLKMAIGDFEGPVTLKNAEGDVVKRTKSGRFAWLQGVGERNNYTYKEMIKIIDKHLEGKKITEKQNNLIEDLKNSSLDEFDPHNYQSWRKAQIQGGDIKEPLQGKQIIDLTKLKPGDKFIINGEEFTHKGLDEDWDIIVEDGKKYKIDPNRPDDNILEVDKFTPKEESWFTPPQQENIKETPTTADMLGAEGFDLTGGKLSGGVPVGETPLERAVRENNEAKSLAEQNKKQGNLPIDEQAANLPIQSAEGKEGGLKDELSHTIIEGDTKDIEALRRAYGEGTGKLIDKAFFKEANVSMQSNEGKDKNVTLSSGLAGAYEEIAKIIKSGEIQKAYGHIVDVAKNFYEHGKTTFKQFNDNMKEFLGDAYGHVKDLVTRAYTEVKNAAIRTIKQESERGAIGLKDKEGKKDAFYSQVEKMIGEKIQSLPDKKVNPDTFKGLLGGTGIKQDELTNTKIKDFLEGKKAVNEKVSKNDVLDYLKEQRTEMKDVVLGERRTLTDKEANERIRLGLMGKLNPEQEARYTELNGIELGTPTPFSTYQEPGGTNYREMFVTAPGKIEQFISFEDYKNINPDKDLGDYNYWKKNYENQDTETIWQDGHSQYSDIQNPVVRIRFNERADEAGRKILFIEEMQGPSKDNAAKMPEWLQKRQYDIGVKRILKYAADNGFDGVSWTPGEKQAARYDLSKHIDTLKASGSSNGLIDLVMITPDGKKHIVNDVAPDKLADHTGKDIADKIISQLNKDTNVSAFIATPEESGYGYKIEHKETGLIAYREMTGKTPEEAMDNFLKARRQDKEIILSGLDLKVGGEGLKSLYDNILPKKFQEITKGKVGETEIYTEEVSRHSGKVYNKDGYYAEPLSVPFVPVPKEASKGYPLYSNPMFNPELIYKELKEFKGMITEASPYIERLGKTIWEEGHTTFKAFQSKMKEYLGDIYGQFKELIGKAYTEVKNAAIRTIKQEGERGAIGPRGREEKPVSAETDRREDTFAYVKKAESIYRDVKKEADIFTDKSILMKRDIKPAIKAASNGLSGAWDGLKKVVYPMGTTEGARTAGEILIEEMGHGFQSYEKTKGALNEISKKYSKSTDLAAKFMDYIQTSTGVLSDKLFNKMSKADQNEFIYNIQKDLSQKTPELRDTAKVLSSMFEDLWKEADKTIPGLIKHRKDFFVGMWEDPESAQRFFEGRAKSAEGSKSYTKPKLFSDIYEGIEAGQTPKGSPLDMAFSYMHNIRKLLSTHKALQAIEKEGGAVLVPSGSKTPYGFTLIPEPYGVITKRMGEGEMGEPLETSYRYAVKEDVAQVFNNYLSSNLYNSPYAGDAYKAYMGAGNTLNQFQLGVGAAFHAGFESMETIVNHQALAWKAFARRDYKQAAKLYLESPLMIARSPMRGDKVIKALHGDSAALAEMPNIIEWVTMAGGRVAVDNRLRTHATDSMLKQWSEGNKMGAVLRSPIAIVEQLARPIMEYLVPRQKMGVFYEKAKDWVDRHPNATHEEMRKAMQSAWNMVDMTMGQVVYERMFMHNIAKNITQGLLRAPGWTGGTALVLGGAAKDMVKIFKDMSMGKRVEMTDKLAYTTSLLVTTAIANGVMTTLMTGEQPKKEDLMAFRTGRMDNRGLPERFLLPTYAKDLYAYMNSPKTTLLNKTHPLISLMSDIAKNKDYYGTEIRSKDSNIPTQAGEVGTYVAKAFVPFWMRGVGEAQERGKSIAGAIAPLVGIMPASTEYTKTDATRLLAEYSKEHQPAMSRTKEEFERMRLKQSLKRDIRAGGSIKPVGDAIHDGRLTSVEGRNIIKNAHLTPFQEGVKSSALRPDEALKVWNKATDDEKVEIRKYMLKKMHSIKNMLPEQRTDMLAKYREVRDWKPE